jgi:hypothetical protein
VAYLVLDDEIQICVELLDDGYLFFSSENEGKEFGFELSKEDMELLMNYYQIKTKNDLLYWRG